MFNQEHRAGAGTSSTTVGDARTGGGATTASLPARPSSELPSAAPPDVQAALALQLQESAATNDFERDPFGLQHARAGGSAPPPATKATGPELVVPKLIEFEDLEVGERQRRETTLWNTGPSEVRVIAADVAIDKHQKQFQLRKVPDRIMPTSSSVAATSGEIAIDFVPQGEGLRTDTLHLTVKTIDASGAQRVFKIVLAGRGHHPGQPTHAEKEKREAETREQDANETAETDREKSRVDR